MELFAEMKEKIFVYLVLIFPPAFAQIPESGDFGNISSNVGNLELIINDNWSKFLVCGNSF